jgi:putative ABC transport system substrate-binding protein
MHRRTFIGGIAVLAASVSAPAQEARKMYRIGYLRMGIPPTEPGKPLTRRSAPPFFWPAMRSLGWIEGENAEIESRFARDADELPALAAELVALNVDVIMTNGTPATQAVKRTTSMIPIVFWLAADPVENGLVKNLARPEGNVTGFVYGIYDEKLLEVLKEALPGASRVAYPLQAPTPAILKAAQVLNLRVQTSPVENPQDFDGFYTTARNGGADAVVIPNVTWFILHQHRIAGLALKYRLPAIAFDGGFARAGGLLSYGPMPEHQQRLPAQIDKILRGAKPADLPVEQPTKFELAINLNTARALRLMIPPSLLVRANDVIK